MYLSDESIQEFKDIYKKEYGKDLTWEEAADSARRLLGVMDILMKGAAKDKQRKEMLKEYPKGFHVEGEGYTCRVCGKTMSNTETWYDKWGLKCCVCQRAIDKKVIPGSIVENEDKYYSPLDLNMRFNIDRHALRRFVKAGILKPRVIKTETGNFHAQIFLIKDNKETLPPKDLTESRLIKETERDGKEYVHSEPWYRFVDPYKHLEGYKIMEYLEVTTEEEK